VGSISPAADFSPWPIRARLCALVRPTRNQAPGAAAGSSLRVWSRPIGERYQGGRGPCGQSGLLHDLCAAAAHPPLARRRRAIDADERS